MTRTELLIVCAQVTSAFVALGIVLFLHVKWIVVLPLIVTALLFLAGTILRRHTARKE